MVCNDVTTKTGTRRIAQALRVLGTCLWGFALCATPAWALPAPPAHYAVTAKTPSSMTLTGHLTLEGLPAGAGAEIAAFDPQGRLCGASGVDPANGGAFILHVYGDDPNTPEDEGASPEDALTFAVYLNAAKAFTHGQLSFEAFPGTGTAPPEYPPRFEDRASYVLNVAAVSPPADSDGDGVADGVDAFPDDIAASVDADGDGFPDAWNSGYAQVDSTTGLTLDAFPADVAASVDADGDGFPDAWNAGYAQGDSTTGLVLDQYPGNPAAHQPPPTAEITSASLSDGQLTGPLVVSFSPYEGTLQAPSRVWVEIDDATEGGGQVLSAELVDSGHPVALPLAPGMLLAGGNYQVQVQHMDATGEWSAWSGPVPLAVPATDPLDQNSDGVQDSAEVVPGTPVYDGDVNISGQPGLVVVAEAGSSAAQPVGVMAGAGTLGTVYVASAAELPPDQQPPATIDLPYGMFSFRVDGLTPGQDVELAFYLPGPLPADAGWLKIDPIDGPVDLTNRTTSDGSPVVTITGNRVVLRLTEGVPPDDADRVANGVLIDPGGPTTPKAASNTGPPAGGGGGGGGCFLGTLSR